MSSTAKKYAEEISELLNGKEFGGEMLNCSVKLIPEKELSASKKLTAIIVPHGFRSHLITRGGSKVREVQLDIGIMRRADKTELAHLLDVVEKIGDTVEGYRFPNAMCFEVEYTPLYDIDAWLQQHSFISVLTARINVW